MQILKETRKGKVINEESAKKEIEREVIISILTTVFFTHK